MKKYSKINESLSRDFGGWSAQEILTILDKIPRSSSKLKELLFVGKGGTYTNSEMKSRFHNDEGDKLVSPLFSIELKLKYPSDKDDHESGGIEVDNWPNVSHSFDFHMKTILKIGLIVITFSVMSIILNPNYKCYNTNNCPNKC